jgi:hypothetical protein
MQRCQCVGRTPHAMRSMGRSPQATNMREFDPEMHTRENVSRYRRSRVMKKEGSAPSESCPLPCGQWAMNPMPIAHRAMGNWYK